MVKKHYLCSRYGNPGGTRAAPWGSIGNPVRIRNSTRCCEFDLQGPTQNVIAGTDR